MLATFLLSIAISHAAKEDDSYNVTQIMLFVMDCMKPGSNCPLLCYNHWGKVLFYSLGLIRAARLCWFYLEFPEKGSRRKLSSEYLIYHAISYDILEGLCWSHDADEAGDSYALSSWLTGHRHAILPSFLFLTSMQEKKTDCAGPTRQREISLHQLRKRRRIGSKEL